MMKYLLLFFLIFIESGVVENFRLQNNINLDKPIVIIFHNYASCPKCYDAPSSMIYSINDRKIAENFEVVVAIDAKKEKQFKKYREIYGWEGKLIYDDRAFRKKLKINYNTVLLVIDKNNEISFQASDKECTSEYSLTFKKLVSALK